METLGKPSLIDTIVETYAPKERTFVIVLTPSVSLEFKVIESYSEWLRLKRGAVEFAKMIEKGSVPELWRPYLPDDSEASGSVFLLSKCCLTDDMNDLEWLKLQAKLPIVFEAVKKEFIERQMREVDGQTAERIDDLKKVSSGTL